MDKSKIITELIRRKIREAGLVSVVLHIISLITVKYGLYKRGIKR